MQKFQYTYVHICIFIFFKLYLLRSLMNKISQIGIPIIPNKQTIFQ